MLFGLCGFCFAFALWFLFVCFALVGCHCTVKAQWIMYRSLFSSSFGAHCRKQMTNGIGFSKVILEAAPANVGDPRLVVPGQSP